MRKNTLRLLSLVCTLLLCVGLLSTSVAATIDNELSLQGMSADASTQARYTASEQLTVIENYITEETKELVTDNYEVYGNTGLTDREFHELVTAGSNKVYLHYRTDQGIDLPYDALLMIKTSEKTYSYEFTESEPVDSATLCMEIQSFLERYHTVLQESYYTPSVSASDNAAAQSTSVPTTFVDANVTKEYTIRFTDKGYIVSRIAVSMYQANSKSLLYIVTVKSSFVPGIVARGNDDFSFGSYLSKSGYVHMTVGQAFDRSQEEFYGIRYGNPTYKKDYWPLNAPNATTITSSIQQGLTLGYSFTNGFSTNGLTLSFDTKQGQNISFGYSKENTKTQDNLTLSVQQSASNTDCCQWYFSYSDPMSQTYHQESNYMFEIANSRGGLFVGDFRLTLNYKLEVFDSSKEIYFSRKDQKDLFVRAGTYREIYDFCSGMLYT